MAELPNRVLILRPVTREAMLFLTQHGELGDDTKAYALAPTR